MGSSWVSAKNMIARINICDVLLKFNEIKPFLKCLIMGNEKRIMYNNQKWIKGESSQAFPKPGLTPKKVILCVCGGIGWELSTMNCFRQVKQFIIYCEKLVWSHQATKRKQPKFNNREGVIFYHGNAHPHTLITHKKLGELG